jgi:hypothetical protein
MNKSSIDIFNEYKLSKQREKKANTVAKSKISPKTRSQWVKIGKRKISLRVDAILPRYIAGEKILKKEQDRLVKKLINDADTYFAKFIRDRDKDKDCITWALETCQHKIMNCCHRISRGYYSHRWDEKNCAWWCVSCNKHYAQDHGAMFENIQIKRYWIDRVDHQRFTKHKRKPNIDELVIIIGKYNKCQTKKI